MSIASQREPIREQGSKGRLPDFLIVGAAKAGTTTLYAYLRRHPRIFMPEDKEPSFFSGNTWGRGLDWYRSLFAPVGDDQICGEASTNYTRWPQIDNAASRIAGLMPDVRLIYLIRDPVDRAYSQYVHEHRVGLARRDRSYAMTFEEYLERDPLLLHMSDYVAQVRHLLGSFPRESLLILTFDELTRSPAAVLQKVFRFLDVADLSETIGRLPIHENSSRVECFEVMRSEVLGPFKRNSALGRIYYALPRAIREACKERVVRSLARRAAGRRYIPPPMRPGTRRALIERFAPSFEELGRLVGADLSAWLDPREPAEGSPDRLAGRGVPAPAGGRRLGA